MRSRRNCQAVRAISAMTTASHSVKRHACHVAVERGGKGALAAFVGAGATLMGEVVGEASARESTGGAISVDVVDSDSGVKCRGQVMPKVHKGSASSLAARSSQSQ